MDEERRVAVTLQLVRNQDDDLIQWLEQFQKGQRNQVLKAALRHALATVGEIEIPQQHNGNGNGDGMAERIMELEAAVAWLTSRVESGAFFADIAQEPQVEAMPQLSKEEVQQRASKLKKAKW